MAWYYKDMGRRGYVRMYVAVAICQRCGAEFTSGMACASKYCPECRTTVYREKNAERQKRFRERKKQKKDQTPDGTTEPILTDPV